MASPLWHTSFFLFVAAAAATSTGSCPLMTIEEEKMEPEKQLCNLYLAESSIPNSGLGIYSGVPMDENQTLVVCHHDAVIPIHDIELHNDYNTIQWLISDYSWAATKLGAQLEAKRVTALAPGLGALANNHHALFNIAMSPFDNKGHGLLHREKNPGAGAITSYHSSHYATRPIEAGSELFHDYGVRWGEKRPKLGPIPHKKHYEEAEKIIACFNQFLFNASLTASDLVAEGVWNEMRRLRNETLSVSAIASHLGVENNENILFSLQDVLFRSSCMVQDVRTRAALDFPYSSLPEATQMGAARASLENFIRPLHWLERHGRCIDGLEVHLSSIIGAGRGAFATRNFVASNIIITTPLLPLNRSMLKTYQFSLNHPGKQRKLSSKRLGHQLLLNYCYGHQDSSSLVFFPYAPVVNMLNHGGENTNARIKWSNYSWHQTNWLTNTSAKDILSKGRSGLLFDIVATKPIQSGGEVFLDYGREWKEAWERQVDSWDPWGGQEHYPTKPYTSDIHLLGAFRSPIGIPDEMFPEKWKDFVHE